MKKTLLDDIVSHIAESVVQRFVKSRKVIQLNASIRYSPARNSINRPLHPFSNEI